MKQRYDGLDKNKIKSKRESDRNRVNEIRSTKIINLVRLQNVFKRLMNVVAFMVTIVLGFLGTLIFSSSRWVLSTFGNLSMDELLFTINSPLEGTNTDLIEDYINVCLVGAVVITIAIIIIFAGNYKRKIYRRNVMLGITLCSIILIANSVMLLWESLEIGEYIEYCKIDSDFIDENYVNPRDVQITFPEQKRNLIYIYLESMESSYMSKDEGGAFKENYIPELTELAKQNINFSNGEKMGGLYSTTGTGWTMGALFGQTTGLPLKAQDNFGASSVDEDVNFIPRVISLGDILEEQGYTQAMMFGSDGKFAGRKNYFNQHGDYAVYDYYYAIEEGEIPPDYSVWWGFEDQKLFSYAKKKITALAEGVQPFNFSLLTVDTHFEDGYLCELCDDEFDDNQYANVLSCSSRQVSEFVEWIQAQDFYENTTIVIVGDHPTMDSDFFENVNEDYDRTVFNTFINAVPYTENTHNRIATTMDMFPTTLSSLGVHIEGNRLGLGTNLFSEETTLGEQVGIRSLNRLLYTDADIFDTFAGGND